MAIDDDLKIPPNVSKYLVMTLNGKGPCTTFIDEYSRQFIHYAAQQQAPVLELGTGYGFMTLEVLKTGAQVIANDLEPRHLELLSREVPLEHKNQLILLPGEFPKDLCLPERSIAGCYVAHMLGYLNPELFRLGLGKLFLCLKSNAKLFIITSTVYKGVFRQLIAPYEQRVRDGDPWPGYFTDLKALINQRVPDALLFFDEHVLRRELERAGFVIETIETYARLDLPKRALWDGREGLVAIARKP
ncbi:class I SAM-dependent methyltransferase [uncultured Legionella sp.]|uniref:class I SAM-dependent methyltransferase n=1 Tax=uncultured Legionella sp. TaxID=210934 RepID=UPI00261B0577|nr:class I SAM-dependent methyltransferase [uncultured Legionella sp.]